MITHYLLPLPRLVASGGPVSRVIHARGHDLSEERLRLLALRESVVQRIKADANLFNECESALRNLGTEERA